MLGHKVKDSITGFEGTVTGYVTYLSGCNQCLVTPVVKKDGSPQDSCWLDEQRLKILSKKAVKLDNSKGNGFDKEAPKR
jgi:hypothetical protein